MGVSCGNPTAFASLRPGETVVDLGCVLKPGGRLAVSDIALKKPLPPELASDLLAYTGCIAGAIPIESYRRLAERLRRYDVNDYAASVCVLAIKPA